MATQATTASATGEWPPPGYVWDDTCGWVAPPLPSVSFSGNRPHKCPVCDGKRSVPCDFYEIRGDAQGPSTTGGCIPDITCRTCSGRGIVWEAG